MLKRSLLFLTALAAVVWPVCAQRKPVLPQIDLPHPYYFREMYLPQLTSGPSSVTWSPDSKEVVYSMAGSLWRQKIDSKTAQQLTDGPGYDYQPDWSPDGKNVVYVSYQKDAMELWLLDLGSGKSQQLTNGGAVNVEPRWSPDGKRIVFVSTSYNKRFHIFRADVNNGKLENIARLTGETKSDLPRYYYSAFDTEISPVWTRDGTGILFVSNRGHIHGSGGFWRMKAEPGADAKEIHYEETNWKARPDFSPDGSRMVYSSYLGRQWHNLWVMPANGGDAFPISYGDWDATNVRWSPDSKKLAFISNKEWNTKLAIQKFGSGGEKSLAIEKRVYLRPRATLRLSVVDEKGKPQFARISVTDEGGRFYAPNAEWTWIQADDAYDRSRAPFEAHYFYAESDPENISMEVPEGPLTIDVTKGFEYGALHRTIDSRTANSGDLTFHLKKLDWEGGPGPKWVGGDLHVHMNYGGTYRSEREILLQQAEGEGVRIVNNLVVNKEQRFPDIRSALFNEVLKYFSWSATDLVGQEYHTSYWGHRGILNLNDHLLLPGYAGYPNTAAASLYPMNADVYDMAHAQGSLVGAVHPFDAEPNPFVNPPEKITDELPVDVALGKLDYMEIVGFSDHRSTAAVWYRLLNLGFHVPAGAGTDATTDYAAPIRGQVGMDRVYASIPGGPVSIDAWMDSLKNGRTFATNGPLIEFTLGGQRVGDELKFAGAREAVPFTAKLRSIVPVDHFEVVCNGRVVETLKLAGTRDSLDVAGTLPLKESGWCVLRASSDNAEYPVLDNYVYATTSPVYVTIGGKAPRSAEDAKYFVAWIERTIDITSHYPDWNSAAEKEYVLGRLAEARAIYEKLSVHLP
ncbi:MAG TPA: CehA/McbA family metallohydrolase [Candidatus Binatus sp.]|nr:CehA/McbA family metallohydrolase [Candidatus Binatus sp.]